MKNKILFILHLPPPVHGAAMVGKYIQDSELVNNKFHCQFINLALAKDLNDIGKGGITKLINFIKKANSIRRAVREFKPNLCYVTPNAKGGAFYKDFIIIQLLKILGCKILVHYHNKGVSTRQNHFIDNILYKIFFKNIKVILLAKSLYPDFQKYVSQSHLYICPNGIAQSPPLITPKNKSLNILFLSNMMEEKGVWTLLEACKILRQKNLSFTCHFVGKWSDISEVEFKKKIFRNQMEQHVFSYGAQYGKDKEKFWQACDLFVFPTYYHNESFPMVLLEAMQQKKACISTDEGGIPEIIVQNETGYIIPKRSPQELANKIEYLIEHPDICHSMGEKGFERYKQLFTLEAFEKRLVSILLECSKS
ncbi:glycosyltransferase family 4 protein [Phocaeicola barnesiae]|uniref:glycosyltransferase family 4 protein n=1 Tax=Phocaeicola barnesiae TaxID=376804 RepID=UPI0025A31616|nr:glycosyltransferase family 4 protein [Phocaeicola barnesiae]MDM8234654.1 glycosyltransferase family 4 protein [Phocaeicola barnesiae]